MCSEIEWLSTLSIFVVGNLAVNCSCNLGQLLFEGNCGWVFVHDHVGRENFQVESEIGLLPLEHLQQVILVALVVIESRVEIFGFDRLIICQPETLVFELDQRSVVLLSVGSYLLVTPPLDVLTDHFPVAPVLVAQHQEVDVLLVRPEVFGLGL